MSARAGSGSHLDSVLDRAGALSWRSDVLDQLEAGCRAAGTDTGSVLELSRATFATETDSADVLVVLTREALALVEKRRRGFFGPAVPVATVHLLADYRDLGEIDDAELPGPAVMFLAPDERRHFMLIWRDETERDRMFPALFDAHRGRYARWGMQLDPASYVADFDRFYGELRATGLTDASALRDWVEREYGEFDMTNALGFALEWRRCELRDAQDSGSSDRVMRVSVPEPWDKRQEARPLIVRLGEQLYEEGLLGPPYDERSFDTSEPLHQLDAGPARLIALVTLAAYGTAVGHPRADEWSEAARRGVATVPAIVFTDRHRTLLSQLGTDSAPLSGSPGALSPRDLAACLGELYPDRFPGHPDELEDLAEELRASGYGNVDAVSAMLARTKERFLRREREDPPAGGGKFTGLGVIRLSLLLDNRG